MIESLPPRKRRDFCRRAAERLHQCLRYPETSPWPPDTLREMREVLKRDLHS